MKPATWVLIADGASARLFAQNADGALQELDHWDAKKPAAPKKVSDYQVDPQRKAQKLFTKRLATTINRRRGEFENLIVVASPRTLGDLKEALEGEVRSRILSEIHRDWTGVSSQDLPGHLANTALLPIQA